MIALNEAHNIAAELENSQDGFGLVVIAAPSRRMRSVGIQRYRIIDASVGYRDALAYRAARTHGLHSRDWMRRDFSWASEAQQIQAPYRWLIQIDEVPK